MNKYTELEKELAELLGWTNVRTSNFYSDPRQVGWHAASGREVYAPKWTSDNAAAFELIVEYELDIMYAKCSVAVYGEDSEMAVEEFSAYESRAAALRVATVKAVILKLKESK